jgi:hypothetical protein
MTTDTNYSLSSAGEMDDLPRTLRREREARERQAREQQAASAGATLRAAPSSSSQVADTMPGDLVPAAVQRLDIPFWRLMTFFLKAVFAAIPALLLLGVLLYFAGELLQWADPELVQTKIIICSPSNPKGCP